MMWSASYQTITLVYIKNDQHRSVYEAIFNTTHIYTYTHLYLSDDKSKKNLCYTIITCVNCVYVWLTERVAAECMPK